jgi:hypothetical protein
LPFYQYAFYLQLSTIGFIVNAAFLGTLYYPHMFILSGLAVALKRLIDNRFPDAESQST